MAVRRPTSPSTRRSAAAASTRRWIQTTATLGLLHVARRDRRHAATTSASPRSSPSGAGACRSWCRMILLDHLGLDPAEAERERRPFQQMKAEGKRLQGAPDRTASCAMRTTAKIVLLALLGLDGGPGRGLVHRPVLRPVLPAEHPEGSICSRPTSLIAWLAPDRHADASSSSAALSRPHRPAEADHPGRLPDRRRHLLPAVRGAHQRRQPATCAAFQANRSRCVGHGRSGAVRLPRVRSGPASASSRRPATGPRDALAKAGHHV